MQDIESKNIRLLTRWAMYFVLALIPGLVSAQSTLLSASKVSQHGITWNFAATHPVGQYANGDWWVLGPVSIVSITPESVTVGGRVMNGSMLNPPGPNSTAQGYDSHTSDMSYQAALNIAPSIRGQAQLVEEGSVVSSISKQSPNSNGRPILDDLAILTVVSQAPAADAFRPSPYGRDKTSYWRESDLDYSILRQLPKVSGVPDIDTKARQALRFWNAHNTNWQQRAVHASNNQPAYGREITNSNGEMLLMLHLDYSNDQKRDLFVGVVQQGLDVYGRLLEGGRWVANGGHNAGRKLPMLFAGLALNDPNIIEKADAAVDPDKFQEDGQTFIVDATHPKFGSEYTESDIGMAEWGIRHVSDPTRDYKSWGASYRWIGAAMVGHALAARLTPGAMAAWNWPPFFDYADRYVDVDTRPASDTNGIQAFQREMWTAYRVLADDLDGDARPKPPIMEVE